MLLTKKEALECYLREGYDKFIPFESKYERSFIDTLESMGVKIIDEEQ